MKIAPIFWILIATAALSAAGCSTSTGSEATSSYLTLVPPVEATDKVDIDIRAGIKNNSTKEKTYTLQLFRESDSGKELLLEEELTIKPGEASCSKYIMKSAGKAGDNTITMKVTDGKDTLYNKENIKITGSDIRSTRRLGGAFVGICHWSETEGKHWNRDIRRLTDQDWRDMVNSMHELGMDIIVIQELFRNEEYAGKHSTTVENYAGKAYYDSELYPGRADITAADPLEAIMSEADRLGIHVMPGIGLFAWFDFTAESLEWHKEIAREVWEKYGHHKSFYGFYIPEESGGSLDNWEKTQEMRLQRKHEIVEFFKQMKSFCGRLAPGKPLMLATNSFGIPQGLDTYPGLLKNLDILCPFGFARMPEGDISGKEAAALLQKLCDSAGAHLWFDLEAFLFNEDNSLYPRDLDGIVHDLELFGNFEKILCYQYPGVFSDPDARIRVGEKKAEELYKAYRNHINNDR